MASFSSGTGGVTGGANGGGGLFIGSFNINSQDLSNEAAKAWLKEAEDADIVALGLQECATVPANPFPEPTNGKAIAMWKQVHDVLLPATSCPPNDSNGHGIQHATATGGGWGSSAVAGVVEAAMTAAAAFKAGAGGRSGGVGGEASTASCSPSSSSSARLCKKARPEPDSSSGSNSSCRGRERYGVDGRSDEGPLPSPCRQEPREQREKSPCQEQEQEQEPESSEPVFLGDTSTRGAGVGGDRKGSSSKGMRQESYYLRGVIEADRDTNFVATIANCIPGRCLVADVAMGETPTYGKRKVNISRNVNASTSFNTSSNPKELKKDSKEKEKKGKTNTTLPVSSSSNGAEAEAISNVEAAIAAATCSRGSTSEGCEGSGLDSSGDGDGPLDASGRPGWPSSSSSSVRNSTFGASAGTGSTGGHDEKDMATADADNAIGTGSSTSTTDAVFKTVEWYGTIRLLVFVRKGLHKDLKVRTVVIPAGDKPSVVADAPQDYAKDTSPDKGAVACYLEDTSSQSPLQLLLVNCHLYGTNKYGVKEAVFDKYRLEQLRAIDLALQATLPTAATAPLVLLGDLNFRVEMLSGTEDKARGGKDFQQVREMAEECNPKVLLDLYNRADRLRLLLEGGGGDGHVRDSPCGTSGMTMETAGERGTGEDEEATPEVEKTTQKAPSLLTGLKDGLKASLMRGRAVRPTFTYKPEDTSSTPRRYNDKRTPSWTDRILWRGFDDDHGYLPEQEQEQSAFPVPVGHLQYTNSTFAAVKEVIASDHEPVYCLLGLPR